MEMCKTLLGFAHFHRLGGYELKTTKTGQITCYKNRTFSFATDIMPVLCKFLRGLNASQAHVLSRI